MSPKKLVHFAEQPAIVVGTGAGPSDSEDSDDYYERMESPPPPTLSPQANTALLGYKQRMMGSEVPIVRLRIIQYSSTRDHGDLGFPGQNNHPNT